MKELRGKVAVVTGAASGIGRAIAERCAQEGMSIVLADIDESTLAEAKVELQAAGADVLLVPTDVSMASDVEALAQKTLKAFGGVHLLCNNAGVIHDASLGRGVWEHTMAEWNWITGVNLWGVIHGIRVFVPIMLEQDTECHIVNTASMAGLLSVPYYGMYTATKHAIVALSETLHRELMLRQAKLQVSVLCPAWVRTNLGSNSARTNPAERRNLPGAGAPDSEDGIRDRDSYFAALYGKYEPEISAKLKSVLDPPSVADMVVQAVRSGKFYILTNPSWKRWIRNRMDDVLGERTPGVFL